MNWVLDHITSLGAAGGFVVTTVLGIINRNQIQEVHLTLNSRLDTLLASVEAAALLKGAVDEKIRADARAALEAKGKLAAYVDVSKT